VSEQNTEQTIRVRQITDVHSNWSYQGELENGKFSYQLILDNGAEDLEGPHPRRAGPLLGPGQGGPHLRQDSLSLRRSEPSREVSGRVLCSGLRPFLLPLFTRVRGT
jgi:hypothetical protein